jgi:nicotinate-nucleotide pyrophosphorylase (carboxylating)
VTITDLVDAALAEDVGTGDVTAEATVDAAARGVATITQKAPGVISGLDVAEAVFHRLDPDCVAEWLGAEGEWREPPAPVLRVSGSARALLTGERTALNFLGRLSGVATATARVVRAMEAAGATATLLDTRKTTPGLRALEKFAVRCGGGVNHRFGLFDAILIKDNHIVTSGGVGAALERARAHAGHMVKVEIEVTNLDEIDEALQLDPDALLLDNMDVSALRAAVREVAGRVITEASGGVNLDTVRAIAETGVDLISVGALTHSAPVLDIGLDFDPQS